MRLFSRFGTTLIIVILVIGLLTLGLPAVSSMAQPPSAFQDVNSLLQALQGQDPAVAMQAAQELKRKDFPTKDLIPALAVAIKSPNEVVRLTTMEALSDRGPEAAPAVPVIGYPSETINPGAGIPNSAAWHTTWRKLS